MTFLGSGSYPKKLGIEEVMKINARIVVRRIDARRTFSLKGDCLCSLLFFATRSSFGVMSWIGTTHARIRGTIAMPRNVFLRTRRTGPLCLVLVLWPVSVWCSRAASQVVEADFANGAETVGINVV